ncbi:MAG: AbrB/MazE/SpoVT family DNA-binding domain-containing protein [Betaproteobacteria bacterium]|nr:AbrB/MazE/SpoVT family DNA-binding domain-containing protein [Betaproteobacteria bacterium]
MRVSKWGNSLAVRLPSSLIRELGLREGEEVEVAVKKNSLTEDGFDTAIRKIREEMPLLPADFKFDREEANAHR